MPSEFWNNGKFLTFPRRQNKFVTTNEFGLSWGVFLPRQSGCFPAEALVRRKPRLSNEFNDNPKTFGSHLARVSFPYVRCDKALGAKNWALLVSPSNRSLRKCRHAEHEPATARLKIPFPQSWVSHVSLRRLPTSMDACKRKR